MGNTNNNTNQVAGGASSAKTTQKLIRRAPTNNGEERGQWSSPVQLDMEQDIYCWDELWDPLPSVITDKYLQFRFYRYYSF